MTDDTQRVDPLSALREARDYLASGSSVPGVIAFIDRTGTGEDRPCKRVAGASPQWCVEHDARWYATKRTCEGADTGTGEDRHVHVQRFDGDDPYLVCDCGAMWDALTGRPINAAARADTGTGEGAGEELREALADWASDFDEGWGDRFEAGDFTSGGFAQLDHGSEHTRKEFRLLRAARASFTPEDTAG